MPFPGPGLAVRIVGEVTEEKLAVAREAYHVVEEELEEYDPWQAFAAVIGKATGVKGDNRVHGWVVAVRSVESRDGMTARAQELDWDTLQRMQSRITGAPRERRPRRLRRDAQAAGDHRVRMNVSSSDRPKRTHGRARS